MDDASRDLVHGAQRGEPSARDELLARHLAGLRVFVRLRLGRILREREDSSDIVQSVCREVLEDLTDFEYRGEGSFRSWLYRRAENKIKDRARYWARDRRDPRREVELDRAVEEPADRELLGQLETFCTPSRHASAREELERVERAFATLRADQRQVILLARVAGLSHEELAREMGRTPLATRSLLSRALARLATALEEGADA